MNKVDEALSVISGYSINDEWSIGMTDEFETIKQYIKELEESCKKEHQLYLEINKILVSELSKLNAIMEVLYADESVNGEVEYKCENILRSE